MQGGSTDCGVVMIQREIVQELTASKQKRRGVGWVVMGTDRVESSDVRFIIFDTDWMDCSVGYLEELTSVARITEDCQSGLRISQASRQGRGTEI